MKYFLLGAFSTGFLLYGIALLYGVTGTTDLAKMGEFLREELGYTGTHLACEHGVCGACTVMIDGRAMRSCLTLAVQADGAEVTTVEGLAVADGTLHPVQQAWVDQAAVRSLGSCDQVAKADIPPVVVARTTDEIVAAREDWEAGRRFGPVAAYGGPRLPAPPFLARPVPR